MRGIRPGGPSGNDARPALTQACVTGTSTARTSPGSANRSGLQAALNAVIPARIAVIRCHSGICGSEASRLRAGSYRDWYGATPQMPW